MATALTYITRAFENLNVFQPGVTIPTAQATQALVMLNQMMGTWAQQLNGFAVQTATVPLVAGQAAYTWFVGGDINVAAPSNQTQLLSATLTLGNTSPAVEVPLALLTDDMYTSIQIKSLRNAQPTAVWFNNASQVHPGIAVWPVPDNALNTIVLYYQNPLGSFANLSTTVYTFPDGYDEAIVYNLERRLSGPYGREMPPEDAMLARETYANIFRSNQRLSDLPNDFALALGSGHRAAYNIQTGNY